ncbi:flagellar protein FlaG [Clostridium senegalense]|uniref:Flagellar protein FlaG n=1 Tax=Clostridium senegalense TaxID=1465809 RepID=A0A6M0GYS8_9CLOT|nr:flagellar protein FlaG [Clostridium senegalense]NEU03489.1 flagellar protein FlaG [Clostridium senegalense]
MEVGTMKIVDNKEVNYNKLNSNKKKDANLVEQQGKASDIQGEKNKGIGLNDKYNSKENIEEKKLKNAVEKLNVFLKEHDSYVKYEQHEFFRNTFIVKIMDKENDKVIKEIPPKKILDMVAAMCEMAGVLLDEKA